MRIELKGLIAAVIAGAAVLGATLGVSALIAASPPSSAPPARTTGTNPPVVSAALIAQGHAFFTQSCASCHGASGGGGFGPSLHHEDLNDAAITLKIKNGVKGKMPAFGSKYNASQTQALVAYIRSLK